MDINTIYTPKFALPHGGRNKLQLKKSASALQALPMLTDALHFEQQRRLAEKSLYEFVKQAWHVVEPGVEFSEGWHIHTICDHLEAVTDRRIKNLLINIPPRHSKSTIVSVIWPVWAWIKNPSEKFLTASYSGSLAVRDAVKSRRLLMSPWFQTRWPSIKLLADVNTKQRYENDDTGYRIAASVGGTTTGEGGSVLILDDPHGAQDAQSDTMRENTIEWLDMVWSSRKNDPRTSCSVTVMQRLHDSDASGHYIKQGNFEHLCLPAEFDGVKRRTSLGYYDPRTEVGELLWPNRFGRPELEALKKALGTYGASGQLQQQPSPEGGGILKTAHVQLWPAHRTLPAFQFICQSYDTAFTEKTTGDPTGCLVLAVFPYNDKQNVMILDAWSEHLAYPDLKERVMEDWKSRYGGSKDNVMDKGRRPDIILVEAKASGQSLLQDLRQSNIPAVSYNPGKADKVQRAHIMAPILESDCIWVLESKKNPGEPISWTKPVLDNWAKFPVVAHDEYTDCATQGIIYLKDNNWLDVPVHEEDEPDRYADDDRRMVNPYSA